MPPEPKHITGSSPSILSQTNLADRIPYVTNPLNADSNGKYPTNNSQQITSNSQNPQSSYNRTGLRQQQYAMNRPQTTMGYGMGYGFPMGMGYGYGMGYGMQGAGPLSWMYTLSQLVNVVGQLHAMVSMNAHALSHMYHQLIENINTFYNVLKNTKVRRWLQRKSKKSKLFRYILIFLSAVITAKAVYLIKLIITSSDATSLITNGVPGS